MHLKTLSSMLAFLATKAYILSSGTSIMSIETKLITEGSVDKPKIKSWITRKRKTEGYNYSLINKMVRDGKIDKKFVEHLSLLSLEEVIGLKLEQANRLVGGKLYGLPIASSMKNIIQNALMMYALSCSRTLTEAASFLGIRYDTFKMWIDRYDGRQYFK